MLNLKMISLTRFFVCSFSPVLGLRHSDCRQRLLESSLILWVVSSGAVSAFGTMPPSWAGSLPDPTPLAALEMAEEPQEDGWKRSSDLVLVTDDLLKQPVWEHSGERNGWIRSGEPLPANFILETRVRVLQRGNSVTLSIGAQGTDNAPGYAYALSYTPSGERSWGVNTIHPVPDAYRKTLSNPASGLSTTLLDTLNSIPGRTDFRELHAKPPSPLSEASYRREIEASLNARPNPTNQWINLKISCIGGHLRMWADGIPVGERRPCGPFSGDAHINLNGSVRIASLRLIAVGEETGKDVFEPVSLNERLNAQAIGGNGPAALRSDALPKAGTSLVEGIPFLFSRSPESKDHVDLGASLFRERNQSGSFMANTTWPSPLAMDPTRMMFTVPNRAYARLWLIAAFDGETGSVPVVTARFFKPTAGFPIDATAEIPALTSRSAPGQARRLPVTKPDGSAASLWLIPIDLDAARIGSELRDQPVLSLELTKAVHPYRS